MKKILTVLCCLAVMTAFSSQAVMAADSDYDSPSDTKVVFDLLFLRPFGVGSLAVGTVFFTAGLPFSIITGSVGKTAELLIQKPFNYTFVRDMGEDM